MAGRRLAAHFPDRLFIAYPLTARAIAFSPCRQTGTPARLCPADGLVLPALFCTLATNLPGTRLCCLGGIIELLQGWSGYRTADWMDLLADSLGVALGWLLSNTSLQFLLTHFDTRLASNHDRNHRIPGPRRPWHHPRGWQGDLHRRRAAWRGSHLFRIQEKAQLRNGHPAGSHAFKLHAGDAKMPALRRVRRVQHAASGGIRPGGGETAGAGRRPVAHRQGQGAIHPASHPRRSLGLSPARQDLGEGHVEEERQGAGGLPRETQRLRRRHARLRSVAATHFRPDLAAGRTDRTTLHPRPLATDRNRPGAGCERAGAAHPGAAFACRRRPAQGFCGSAQGPVLDPDQGAGHGAALSTRSMRQP